MVLLKKKYVNAFLKSSVLVKVKVDETLFYVRGKKRQFFKHFWVYCTTRTFTSLPVALFKITFKYFFTSSCRVSLFDAESTMLMTDIWQCSIEENKCDKIGH